MEIEIARKDQRFQFEAYSSGQGIDISASPELAGTNCKGLRPMQLILSALGSCMSIDVLNILYKQRQQIDSFKVKVNGTRSEGIPSIFTHIDIIFDVHGHLHQDKLAKAIKLSEETYCSVHRMLSPQVKISTTYNLNHEN